MVGPPDRAPARRRRAGAIAWCALLLLIALAFAARIALR
jgi:hypothetical protein